MLAASRQPARVAAPATLSSRGSLASPHSSLVVERTSRAPRTNSSTYPRVGSFNPLMSGPPVRAHPRVRGSSSTPPTHVAGRASGAPTAEPCPRAVTLSVAVIPVEGQPRARGSVSSRPTPVARRASGAPNAELCPRVVSTCMAGSPLEGQSRVCGSGSSHPPRLWSLGVLW